MGIVIYQFWGAGLVGLGFFAWATRKIRNGVTQNAILRALIVTNTLNCGIAIRGQYAGANALGWPNVVLFALFTLAFGFILLRKTQQSTTGTPDVHLNHRDM